MACFLVPGAEAAVVTIATKIMEKNEKKSEMIQVSLDHTTVETVEKVSFTKKLKWLTKLQWGGAALLAFEHVWHGEVVPFFPFLTAMSDTTEAIQMFHEMATIGVTMAVLTTLAWAGMVAVSSLTEKKAVNEAKKLTAEAEE